MDIVHILRIAIQQIKATKDVMEPFVLKILNVKTNTVFQEYASLLISQTVHKHMNLVSQNVKEFTAHLTQNVRKENVQKVYVIQMSTAVLTIVIIKIYAMEFMLQNQVIVRATIAKINIVLSREIFHLFLKNLKK